MSKETHLCHSEKETIEFAKRLAEKLEGGEVFALSGDLGCGKTTFVKGLVLGLQSRAIVTSPTFNLVHRYLDGRLSVIHYDLYRLKKFAETESLDLEVELEEKKVVVIEWPQFVKSILPPLRTHWIEFQEVGPAERLIQIYPLNIKP